MFFSLNRPRSKFEIEPSKPYFILQSLFWQGKWAPKANICGNNFLSPLKIWDWKLSLEAERGIDTVNTLKTQGALIIFISVFETRMKGKQCWNNRSGHRKSSVKKAALKKFAYFAAKHLCWSFFLIKLQT